MSHFKQMKAFPISRSSLYISLWLLLLFLALPSSSRPFRGSIKWSFLLCRFSDSSTPSRTPDFFRDMIITQGTGSLNDYWRSISYGTANLDGSEVKGWYMMTSSSTDASQELAKPDRDRGKYFRECVAAAQNSPSDPYTVPPGNSIAVITEPSVDLWGSPGQAFFPSNIDIGGFSHEVGHGIGLAHSFSDDPNYRNIDWAQIGEYDDQWDIMSYANVFSTWNAQYGSGGPGLNGYHADSLGWLPKDRIFTFGSDGQSSQSITLAALNHPEAGGFLLVRIPFDPSDLRHYYTVEFRKNDNWDAGIGNSIVLIHEIKGPSYVTYLLRERSDFRAPIQSLSANGVWISVTSVSPDLNQATVYISSDITDRCLQGYVWREADFYDHVCVTPDIRDQTSYDNSQAAFRRSSTGGNFGADTCIDGYVWREAFTGDHVCVTPDVRAQAWADNADAGNRNNPSRFCYGPNTCKSGYVWREADRFDYVCVGGDVRQQAWDDNSQAQSRVNPNGGDFGPDTCVSGYVWREAYPGDHVCVSPDVRSQAWADNNDAPNRWAFT